MRGRSEIGLLLAVVLASGAAPGTRAQEPSQAPATVQADAIALGAKLAEAAPTDFLKWAQAYAKKGLLKEKRALTTAVVTQTIGKQYPQATPQAREAGAFLVWYLGYTQQTLEQTTTAGRIHRLDQDIADAEQATRYADRAATMSARGGQAEVERAQTRLDQLVGQRQYQRWLMAQFQARADVCLKRLAALYETVKNADPALLQQLK